MRRLLAACGLALAVAGPALAEPSVNDDLSLMGQSEAFAYFYVDASPVRTGSSIDVWVLAALPQATHTAEGDDIVGGWMRLRVDCDAGTVAGQESMLIRQDLSTTLHSNDPDPPRNAPGESAYGALRDHLCHGAPIDPDLHATGLVHALRVTRDLFTEPRDRARET